MAEYIGFSSEMKSPEDEIVGVRMYNLGGRAASEGILPLRRFAGMQPHRFRHVRLARQAGQRQTLSIRVRSWTTHQRFILESWAPSAGNSPRRRTWRRTEQCRLTRHRSAVAGSRVLEQHQLIRTVCRWSLVAGRWSPRSPILIAECDPTSFLGNGAAPDVDQADNEIGHHIRSRSVIRKIAKSPGRYVTTGTNSEFWSCSNDTLGIKFSELTLMRTQYSPDAEMVNPRPPVKLGGTEVTPVSTTVLAPAPVP
jgi:hypothetical protein